MYGWLDLTLKALSAVSFNVLLFAVFMLIWVSFDYNAYYQCELESHCFDAYIIDRTEMFRADVPDKS
ncbi:hypothetical protein [Alteromonas macleodii]|uniref:Uncharacterized protein n=1 Tax=Alteromonas macleodii TaxID=28108 RepID=A0AB36FP81_ALTMA|nr:hypothetical protein [Alteromonas macleodii]OES24229.1 hypothetical protein BFV93_4829 [Alteromonas macleodii]OES24860.1 hypothetical protein BFV95_4619 [Alteromonas macleodii]OES25138.1 hypothetical protein BFV94_4609 [Alteromonas macleodii]OES39180.1 hypothetical protein BFV96_4328 [Alteromonas macleodii]